MKKPFHNILTLLAASPLLLAGASKAAGPDINYFGSMADAVAACQNDAVPWNTGCIPDTPSYVSWCSTIAQGSPGPNLASYSRVLQQYQPSAPYYNCLTPASTTYIVYAWPKTACAAGTSLVGPTGYDCLTPTVIQQAANSQKQLGQGIKENGVCSDSAIYGNPCDASTGNKIQIETDFAGGDGIPSFVRSYNSLDLTNPSSFGAGWSHNQLRFLSFGGGSTSTITVVSGDGQREVFTSAGGGVWVAQADSRRRLTQGSQGFKASYPDGAIERYSPDGRLLTDTDRFGRTTTYTYSGGRLIAVTGPYGHKITFTGRSNGCLVTYPSGSSAIYAYDANFNLTTIQYQDSAYGYGTTRTFKYENTGFPHGLTGIVDELGARVSTYTYDAAAGRAVRTEQAGGGRRFDFAYAGAQTTVTDAAGNADTLTFQRNLGVNNLVRRVGPDGKILTQSFDAANNLLSRTDEEGRTTNYTYDTANRVATVTEAAGSTEARTTSITYVDPFLTLPATITAPSVRSGQEVTTTISYSPALLPSQITRSGFDPAGNPVSRSVALTYTSDVHVATIDGPRTDIADITTFDYWACTTGGKCGQVKSITNPLGQITTFDTYTNGGLVTKKTDPNGLVTTYTYDYRDRLLTLTETPSAGAARTTTFIYNKAGDLLTATLPGGTVLTYAYTVTHDLASVKDNLGNKVSYSYDLRGNRIQEKVTDSALILARQVDFTFDIRNRMATINRAGSLTQTVFDAIGNLTDLTDPNGHATTNSYDPLNRIIQSVDALGGTTATGHDPTSKPSSITSPNGAAWALTHDDLGNELIEASPDRGVVASTFDAAGNPITRSDARGITATRTYDTINRLTGITYPAAGEDVAYTWDTCANGKGRLCGVADPSGTRSFTYDGFGRVTSIAWATLGQTYTTSYTWTPADKLASITYPTGRTVNYTRNALGQITAVASGAQNIVSARAYRPDGLLKGQTYGNGLVDARSYDLQGRITSWATGTVDARSYGYDATGNITAINGSAYGYDGLDRLTTEPSQAFAYDGNGNRLQDGAGGYGYSTSSNRMATSPAGSVMLDASGNTTGIGSKSFAYNQAGRLITASSGGNLVGQYGYAFDGHRASKTAGGATTLFHYDLAGNLIAETDASGAPLKEYVWDDEGRPLAQIAGGTLTFLHPDHLGTPRLGTDAGRAIVWQWYERPFGTGPPGGAATVNLRYPGQYFDAESGLHQNWHRTYDPGSGRYLESDPVGLAAGVNTFGYVGGNPLSFIDPMGLWSVREGVDAYLDWRQDNLNTLTAALRGDINALYSVAMGLATGPAGKVGACGAVKGTVGKRSFSASDRAAGLERSKDVNGTPRCQYCGTELDAKSGRPNSYEADHTQPHSRGGPSSTDNLTPSCRTCNRSKGARTLDEWRRE